jgi:hypothetical protein
VNERLVLERVEDGFEGIFHRKDKTGRELLQRTAGIHERGRIREKGAGGHQVVKSSRRVAQPRCRGVETLGLGDVPGDASIQIRRRFDDGTGGILGQVPVA